MKISIIEPYAEVLNPPPVGEVLAHIERCGRICYKSENRITGDSAASFVKRLIDAGHESVLEHCSVTVLFVVDRGISHEIVRHRIGSFSMESTRYVDYKDELVFIRPAVFLGGEPSWRMWLAAMTEAAEAYDQLRKSGFSPQYARSVLPHSIKTELAVTFNMRQWRHFFRLRTATAAHPQMRQVVGPLLEKMQEFYAPIFDDI